MALIKTTSPAYNRSRIDGDTNLVELPLCGKINLRGDPDNSRFIKIVEAETGLTLPVEANTCTTNGSDKLYWLGPNEWLMHCDIDGVTDRILQLKSKLSGIHSAIVDVSDYYTVLQLDSPHSSALISKACPLDLHASVFPKGACTQTRFGHASILLHKISKTPTYDIQVRWTYTEYVWDYLISAMNTL